MQSWRFTPMTSSEPDDPPKAPPAITSTLGIRVFIYELQGIWTFRSWQEGTCLWKGSMRVHVMAESSCILTESVWQPWLWHCPTALEERRHRCGRLGEGYMRSICIISYHCLWIYDHLNPWIKNLSAIIPWPGVARSHRPIRCRYGFHPDFLKKVF